MSHGWMWSIPLIDEISHGEIPEVERLQKLEMLREKNRTLIVKNELACTSSYSLHTDISNSVPEQYTSEMFSNLPYQDLKKAHTETIIPVTSEDARKEQFTGINDILQHRNISMQSPLSLQQANKFLADKANIESSQNTNRAYKLARQSEIANNIQNKFNSHFDRILN